jgi:hypothetical protein
MGNMHSKSLHVRRREKEDGMRQTRHTLVLLVLSGMATGCGEGRAAKSGDLGSNQQAVGGAGVIVTTISRASDLRTPEGVAGAVGRVISDAGAECTATLIGRKRALTATECAFDVDSSTSTGLHPKSGLAIFFPQGEEGPIPVTPMGHPDVKWSILMLAEEVSPAVVANIPMLFTGDFDDALGSTLQTDAAVVAGFGATCSGCQDEGVRRAGQTNVGLNICAGNTPGCPFSTSLAPYLVSDLDPSEGAALYGLGDAGSPLFLWHTLRQEYVLAGIQHYHEPKGDIVGWEVFGIISGSDRWLYTYQFWHANGITDFYPQGLQPPGAVRVIGEDLDSDRIIDEVDNCPPSACDHFGLDPLDCANTDQKDSFGDGLGDFCRLLDPDREDACTPEPNCLVWMKMGDGKEYLIDICRPGPRNSNKDAERAVGVKLYRDTCDPVPLLRVEGKTERAMIHPFTEYQVQPWVGSKSLHATSMEEVDFRYCGCYDQHSRVQERGECLQDTCNAGEAHRVEGTWVDGLYVIGKRTHTFIREVETIPTAVSWYWQLDASSGIIPSHAAESTGGPNPTTRGFFASTVLGENWHSLRDWEAEGRLRPVLDFRSGEEYASSWIPDIPDLFCVPCLWFPPIFEQPKALYGNPPRLPPTKWRESVLGSDTASMHPLVLVAKVDAVHGIHENRQGWDVSSALCPALASTLSTSEAKAAFLLPVETGTLLESAGIPATFVAVTGFDTGAPQARLVVESDGIFCHAGPPAITLPADPLLRFSYAGSEGKLYQVGGGAGTSSSIVRWELETGSHTSYLPTTYPPSPFVLATAYDGNARTLYVLDVQGEPGKQEARLVAHDLDSETSGLLWSVPFQASYSWYALNVDEYRQLVLSAGTTAGFQAWRIDPQSGAFIGKMEGTGGLAALPAMGRDRLSLQSWSTENGVQNHVLGAWAFESGDACTEL